MDLLTIEYLFVKPDDQFCKSVKGFNNLLKTDSRVSIDKKILTCDKKKFEYLVKTGTTNHDDKIERYFHVKLSRKINSRSAKNLQKGVKELNDARRILIQAIPTEKIKTSILWDDISNYYSSEAYPLINELENLMRKLIMKFMLTTVGLDWLKKATPQNIREEIGKNAERNKIKGTIENALFEADFIHLNGFLFKPYSTISTDDLYNIIENTEDTDTLDLEELKDSIPKSNWDRYFSDLIQFESLEKKWEKLYSLRNKVAHNKPLSTGDYDEVVKLHGEISDKLIQAIETLDDLKIEDEQKEEVSKRAVSGFISGRSAAWVDTDPAWLTGSAIWPNTDPEWLTGSVVLPNSDPVSAWHKESSIPTGSLSINTRLCPKCKRYKDYDYFGLTTNGWCSECSSDFLSSGSNLDHSVILPTKSCSECGKPFASSAETIGPEKCDDCKGE